MFSEGPFKLKSMIFFFFHQLAFTRGANSCGGHCSCYNENDNKYYVRGCATAAKISYAMFICKLQLKITAKGHGVFFLFSFSYFCAHSQVGSGFVSQFSLAAHICRKAPQPKRHTAGLIRESTHESIRSRLARHDPGRSSGAARDRLARLVSKPQRLTKKEKNQSIILT